MRLSHTASLFIASLLLVIPQRFSQRVPTPLPSKKAPPTSASNAFYSNIRSYSGAGELAFVESIQGWNGNRLQEWKVVGPMNSGGRIRGLAIDHRDPNILLCGGVSGGIFRSTDAATTWSTVESPAHIRLSSLAQDTRMGHGDRWYATTGEWSTQFYPTSGGSLGHGVYKSQDNGMSWSQLPSTVDVMSLPLVGAFSITHRVQVHPTTGDVYVATVGGIHRSQDGGQTWNLVLGSLPPEEDNSIPLYLDLALLVGSSEVHITSDGMIYGSYNTYPPAGEGEEMLPALKTLVSSTGDLDGWTDITSPMFGERISRTVIRSAPSDPSLVYFLCSFWNPPNGPSALEMHGRDYYLYLYQRPLEGAASSANSWQDLSENVPDDVTQWSYNMEIAVHPENPSEVFLGLVGLYRSDNGFRSPYIEEEQVASAGDDPHGDQHRVVFGPIDSDVMYVANDGGVYKTENSRYREVLPGRDAAFQRADLLGKRLLRTMNNGLGVAQIYDLALVGGDNILVGTQDQGAWVGDSPESDWFSYEGGDVFRTSSSADGLFTILTLSGTEPPKVYLNQDPSFSSRTEEATRRLEEMFVSIQHGFDPTRLYRMIGTSATSLAIYDDMNTWMRSPTENPPRITSLEEELYVGPILTTYPEVRVYGLTFGNSDLWALGESAPKFLVGTGLNSDNPLLRTTEPDVLPKALPSDLFVNRYDAREMIASFHVFDSKTKIVHSKDAGVTWVDVTGNLASESSREPGPSVMSVAIAGDGVLFLAGTTSGLFVTSNLEGNTTQWGREAESQVNNHIVTDIEVDRFSRVTIATYGGGAYRVVYDIEPAPVYFTDIPQQVLVPIGTGTNTETVDLDLADYLEGSHRELDISSHPGELVEISREGTILTFKGMEPGRGSVSVVAHAMEENKGDVLSFPIRVYEQEAAAQISTKWEIGSSRKMPDVYINFRIAVRNTGSQPFLITGNFINSSNIIFLGQGGNAPHDTFPLEIAPASSEDLRYFYFSPSIDANPLSGRITLVLSEHPFRKEVEVDFANSFDDVVDDGTVMMLGDAKTNSEFLFFPNPVGERLILVCSTETLVGLYNLGGQALQTFIMKDRTEMDTSSLPPGIYLLEERSEGASPRLHRIIRR